MNAGANTRSLPAKTVRQFRSSWKSLFITDIAFKVIAFVVLTPLVGLLFRTLIAFSGNEAVSDMDILFFFLGPVGWFCAVLVGALWLAIAALEQASLLGIICAKEAGKRLEPIAALQYAAGHALPVVRVTIRLVALTLLAVAPFLVVAAVTYFALLTEYDINFYLTEKPTVFKVAVAIGAVIAVSMLAVLLRLITSWLFALPLVLFENIAPRDALRESTTRTRGDRRTLLAWIVVWGLAITVLSTVATALIGAVGHVLTPDSTESLHLLVLTVGVTLFLWALLNLAVNILGTTTFAALLFETYWECGGEGKIIEQFDFATDASSGVRFRITRKRLLIAGIVGVVLAGGIGVAALHTVRSDDDVMIMAHRGSSKAAPENTMAAFRQAIEDGADWIELDVQETADGEVVVLHDSDFMKLASNNLKIWNATLDDLTDIDIGSWFDPKFQAERVPTLSEVLEECKGKIGVNIELKYYGHDEQLEQRVAEIVDAQGMSSDVVAMSLKRDGVTKMKSIRPDWKVGLLMSVSAGDLKKLDADFLAVNAKFANRQLIRNAHSSGKDVYVWTVNDAATMSTMISRGVDGLLTDKPALARSVLEQRAEMSTPERLLLELAGLLGTVPEIAEQ